MIQIVEAPPRSGKSYFAVNYLVGFTRFDDLYQEYILDPDVLIISNIEGLKINHWTLNKCLNIDPLAKLTTASLERVVEFFSISNFEAIQKKTGKQHIILLIDEAHELFPSGFKNQDVYEFFAYHGHIGLDVFFLTQGIESLTRQFLPLLEFIVKATPRSKKISRTFSYKYCDRQGKYLFSKSIRCKQPVFNAYMSFRKDEHNKPKSAVMQWLIIVCIFAVMAVTIFKVGIGMVKAKGKRPDVPAVEMGVSAPVDGMIPVDAPFLPPPAPVDPPAPSVPVAEWYRVDVNAVYVLDGVKYLVLGDETYSQDSELLRRFNNNKLTVDFYGLRPLPTVVPSSAQKEKRPRGRSDSGEVKALAVTPIHSTT